MAVTDYSGTADLARRRYELAKSRSESNLAQQLGQVGQQYYGLARQQEAGLEGRGILRSGEANRRRVELGAEEKARRLALSQQAEQDIQSAALDYASVLAEIQAKGATGTTTPQPEKPKEPTPTPGGGGTPGAGTITRPVEGDQRGSAPAPTRPTPTVTDCGPGFYFDPVEMVCKPISSGGPAQPGMPQLPPGQGGVNEIGSGGRPFGTPPTQGPTVGGITVPSGQTPSETRGVAPTPIATPAPGGQVTIGGVTAPASQWNAAFAALAAAAARNQAPAAPVGTVNPRLR